MANVVETVVIHASRDRVFDYRLDLHNLPRYNPDVSDLAPSGNSVFQFRVRLVPGLRWPCRLTVTEAARPRRICFSIESMMTAVEVCTFEEAQVEGRPVTSVRFETNVATRGGPFAKWIDAAFVVPTLRKQTRSELKLMKQQLDEW